MVLNRVLNLWDRYSKLYGLKCVVFEKVGNCLVLNMFRCHKTHLLLLFLLQLWLLQSDMLWVVNVLFEADTFSFGNVVG